MEQTTQGNVAHKRANGANYTGNVANKRDNGANYTGKCSKQTGQWSKLHGGRNEAYIWGKWSKLHSEM